jgi:hypothetical protein
VNIYIPNWLLVFAYVAVICVVQAWPWRALTAIPVVLVGAWILAVITKAAEGVDKGTP